MTSRLTTALAAAFACALLTVAPAVAAPCAPAGYAYAGVQSPASAHGIAARLTALATPVVERGHVAGWVGVGAPGEGPGGSDSWIQVGLNSVPGSGNTLYYEVTIPFAGTRYTEIARDVPAGRALELAVLEVAGMRDHWRVWVDGRPLSPALRLEQSHGRLTPMAMTESWGGGRSACNRYAYRFEQVSLATVPGGAWRPVRDGLLLRDPGFRLLRRSPASFDASTEGPPPAAAAWTAPAPAPASARPAARAQRPQVARLAPVVAATALTSAESQATTRQMARLAPVVAATPKRGEVARTPALPAPATPAQAAARLPLPSAAAPVATSPAPGSATPAAAAPAPSPAPVALEGTEGGGFGLLRLVVLVRNLAAG